MRMDRNKKKMREIILRKLHEWTNELVLYEGVDSVVEMQV